MTKKYTYLSLTQRYQIQVFLKSGMNEQMIGLEIGVHPSTISRESGRNIAKEAERQVIMLQPMPSLKRFTDISLNKK